VISTRTDWSINPPGGSLQFKNFTITAGNSLTVPSGITIRATGTVTLGGPIIVEPNPYMNVVIPSLGSCSVYPAFNSSANGVGAGGIALNPMNAKVLFNPGVMGGGNGTGAGLIGSPTGLGGGSLRIFAAGAILANSNISADGRSGADAGATSSVGGGGGGIIILASRTRVTNTGEITAVGGAGGDGFFGSAAPGAAGAGGGGGGILHFLAPQITAGSLSVSGGPGGAAGSTTASSGGGGACGGDGGQSGTPKLTGDAGSQGLVFTTIVNDPATFMQ
jgi:hypothetical protein